MNSQKKETQEEVELLKEGPGDCLEGKERECM